MHSPTATGPTVTRGGDFPHAMLAQDAGEPIAVVGAACRLPGAPDLDSLATLLLDERDAVTEIPEDRWSKTLFLHPEPGRPGKAYTFAAGVLDQVYGFDPAFFGISPREAAQMDPQQRLLLELAHEAIEDAGISGAALAGGEVGVYVGASSWDYLNLHIGDPSVVDAYSMTGATLGSLSNRISYVFDLAGPSLTVDTACSSSLVALHLACEAIRAGRVEAALVGGVNLLLAPHGYVGFCRASMLSRRGRCHAFDARADGYVRAEGGGMVMLKPLAAALADGDRIRAVVRATGVNSDGRTAGLSLPSEAAQAALLRDTYARFGISPDELSYVEAHGTGTPAGDPIEARALGAALGLRRSSPLPIGSVKTNIGHLEAASGMAGLLKAMAVLQSGVIPRSLHCETPNPAIPFAELNLQLVPKRRLVRVNGHPPAVGVNSFGFGGANAHAVLGLAPARKPEPETRAELPPLLLSARSHDALRALVATWSERLAAADPAGIAPALRAAARLREHHPLRVAAAAPTPDALAEALDGFLAGADGLPLASGSATLCGGPVFVFSGNGSQWVGMGADAIRRSAAFRAGLVMADEALAPRLGWSIRARLAETAATLDLRDTAVSQPLLFAIQVAAVEALRAQGVHPVACMGHSVGEVAAAWAAGALTLAQAARVICARSRRQQDACGGAMAVLGLPLAEAEAAIAPFALEVAAENASANVTVAGPAHAVAELAAEAARRGWPLTRLDLDHAFHSAEMDSVRAPLLADLKGLAPASCAIPFVSTVTGAALDGCALDAGYWWENVRLPVRFAEAAHALVSGGARLFVEVGPQPVLQSYLQDALRRCDADGAALAVLTRRRAAADPFAMAALRCHVAGCDLSRAAVFDQPGAPDLLPRYPWQRGDHRLVRTDEATDLIAAPREHELLGVRDGAEPDSWLAHLDLATSPWLADHAAGGAPVLPAAAVIDLMLAAARARHPTAGALELAGLEITRALALEPGQTRAVRCRMSGEVLTMSSRARLSGEAWSVHATARLGPAATAAPLRDWDLPEAQPALSAEELHALAARLGLDYGPAFRTVRDVASAGPDAALVRLRPPPPGAARPAAGGPIDPTLLDGAFQGLLALASRRVAAGGMVPWRFGHVRLLGAGEPAEALLRVTRAGPRAVAAEILLRDAAGVPVMELLDCWFVSVGLGREGDPARRCFRITHEPAASLAPLPSGLLAVAVGALDIAPDEAGEMAGALADAYVASRAQDCVREAGPDLPSPAPGGLLDELLGWLEADGAAERRGAVWVPGRNLDLPPADQLLRSLLFDVPAAAADAALLAAAGEALAATLRLARARPAPPAALLEQFLTSSPGGRAALDALADAAAAVAAAWPAGRLLRVLEVCAGRGAASRLLVRRLRAALPGIRYVAATDADAQPMLADALSEFPEAAAVAWSPGDHPPGTFDLVVSAQGLTRLRLDDDGLAALRSLLAPGGLLLAAEPAPNRVWSLIGVPATDGAPAAPRDSETWRGALEAAGMDCRLHALKASSWPSVLIAAEAPASVAAAPAVIDTVLLACAPGDRLAGALAQELADRGVACKELAGPLDADALQGAAGVALLALDSDAAAAASWLALAASFAAPLAGAGLKLWIATRADVAAEPFAAALDGLRRVLANEAPNVLSRTIRLGRDLGLRAAAARLADEILDGGAEQEVAWSAARRRVPRVRAGLPAPVQSAGPAMLAVERSGVLGSLRWRRADPREPGPGEVAIAVRAAGLNFRDVMWASGLLPDEALLHGFAGATLGLECAGVVTAVGAGIDDLSVGDRVMAFAPSCLGTDVITPRHAVARLPAGMSFCAGATIPVVFFTVVHALGELARLEPGERVLIHGAAGGVGLAAIQYARHRGAVVFATAGSDAKRALLRQLGVEHVLDSRSLAFADEVMALTGGQGVDVVLNSLSGEAMERSLGLLRPFGRFLELGKRDFYRDTQVGIRPLRHNASYFAIDADQLPLARPKLAARLLGEVTRLLEQGALRPLPYRAFAFADAVEAFRLMQSAGHVGKIVLEHDGGPLPLAAPPPPAFIVDEDGTYLVTGGLGGFGLEAARWLVRHGARHLALVGRRGCETPGARELLAAFAEQGVHARAIACDVADEAAVAAMLNVLRAQMPPLRGVVHAAMVMDDAFLPDADAARFERVLQPKWAGADALDRLTRDAGVELFVLFSSVTTALGNPGQAAYVAANAALEAVAERRHAAGLPALAVGWGPIGDAGYLARAQAVSEALARRLGTAHLRAAEALDALPAMLASGAPVVHLADLAALGRREQLPLLASPLFEAVARAGAEGDADRGGDLKALVAGRAREDARRAVAEALANEVAAVLQLPPGRVELSRPLAELGMDSLMAVELRLAVEARFGASLPLFSLSEGLTVAGMAARLVDPLLPGEVDAPAAAISLAMTRHEAAPDVAPDPGEHRLAEAQA